MEEKDKTDPKNDRESTSEKENTNSPKKEEDTDKAAPAQNVAGPSSKITLPGSIESMKYNPLKPGLSKSEHNIRHIITAKDVTNALNMASLSFGTKLPVNMTEIRIPLPEIRIPLPEIQENVDKVVPNELKSLVELQKFMESCLKTKEGNNILNTAINLKEVNIQNIKVPLPNLPTLQELPNSSCIRDNIQTDCVPVNLPILNPSVIEPKLSKSDKKKTSGSLSERSDFPVAQRDSLSSIGSNVCRICMTRGKERLISPCNCKGSLANVHLSCLERWLNQVGRNHCELCGFRLKHGPRLPRLIEEGDLVRGETDIPRRSLTRLYRAYLECLVRNSYPAIRTPRYTVLQALRLWFGNPRNRSHLQSDCLIFWLLSTVTAGLLAVCIVGTQYFVIEGNKFGKQDAVARKGEGISHRITETAMDFFMAIVLCGYSVTVYLLWKDHYVMWNRWRRANVNVRLLLTPDANPVPFVPNPRYSMV